MIELYDGYAITVDAYNYTLVKHTGRFDKKKTEVLYYMGYYSSLQGALNGFADLKVRTVLDTKEPVSIKTALETIQGIYSEFDEFLEKNLPEYTVVPKG